MKLGVFFIGNPASGGLFQYSLNILDSLKSRSQEVVIFNLSGPDYPQERYRGLFRTSGILRLVSFARRLVASTGNRLKVRSQNNITVDKADAAQTSSRNMARLLKILVKLHGVNLNIFTAPTQLSFLMNTPFIMPIHDLQHRLNPQFPEVSSDGLDKEREYIYANSLASAAVILVDSDIGKEDVLSCYPVEDSNRIKILPFTPSNYLCGDFSREELDRTRQKYHLPPRFLFYPANFWAHKNHKAIIQALSYIKKNHELEIPIVFVGTKTGRYNNYTSIQELIYTCELGDQVLYLGYVTNDDMGCLYKLAEALVMPTFFGPTNIPFLEAFALGCPVIGSDIRGVREQIGDAGLLVDPNSSEDLAAAILRIWNDEKLRDVLIEKGYARIRQWDFDRFVATLNRIIDDAIRNLQTGNTC